MTVVKMVTFGEMLEETSGWARDRMPELWPSYPQ